MDLSRNEMGPEVGAGVGHRTETVGQGVEREESWCIDRQRKLNE